ncbi:unnamed protein product [Penicillium egyptiacum]|uniref:Uncharacterized protein n=1 Tax=Penicillium egyptiacum TaxID=1303716 RepID=A0A9W4K7G2_9EURO|nr:unnamed protein product [Penicillium egyptiacum]
MEMLILTEGIFTVLLRIFTYFFTRFSSYGILVLRKEKAFTQARLPSNSPRAAEANFNLRELITTLKNRRICFSSFAGPSLLSAQRDSHSTNQPSFPILDLRELFQPENSKFANKGQRSMGETQLLNIPSAVFAVILIVAFGIFADTGGIPRLAIPLGFMTVILACYGVLYAFPNNGGVYAATIIVGGFSTAW